MVMGVVGGSSSAGLDGYANFPRESVEATLTDRLIEALSTASDIQHVLQDVLPLRPVNPAPATGSQPESARDLLSHLNQILRESREWAVELQRAVGGRV